MPVRSRIYLGRLSYRATQREVERFFRGYGRIVDVQLKNGYGFVDFDNPRDAEDAVYDLNGKDLCGERVIVEIAKGTPHGRDLERDRGGHGGGRGRRSRSRSRSRSPPPRRRSRSPRRSPRRSSRRSRSRSPPPRRSSSDRGKRRHDSRSPSPPARDRSRSRSGSESPRSPGNGITDNGLNNGRRDSDDARSESNHGDD